MKNVTFILCHVVDRTFCQISYHGSASPPPKKKTNGCFCTEKHARNALAVHSYKLDGPFSERGLCTAVGRHTRDVRNHFDRVLLCSSLTSHGMTTRANVDFSSSAATNHPGLPRIRVRWFKTVEGSGGFVPGVFTMPERQVSHASRNDLVFDILSFLVTYVREAESMEDMRIVAVFVAKVQTPRRHDD